MTAPSGSFRDYPVGYVTVPRGRLSRGNAQEAHGIAFVVAFGLWFRDLPEVIPISRYPMG